MEVGGGVLPIFVKSHRRVLQFGRRTYATVLRHHGCLEHPESLHVFVSTEEDEVAYARAFPGLSVHRAPLGVRHVDHFIAAFAEARGLPEYLYLNDDLLGVFRASPDGRARRLERGALAALVARMLRRMRAAGASYGGLFPSGAHAHRAARLPAFSCGLACIMDNLSLVRRPRRRVEISVSDKSDFEKAIQHFAFAGSLLRANHYFVKKRSNKTYLLFWGKGAWRIARSRPAARSRSTLARCRPGETSLFLERLGLPAAVLAFEESDSRWKVRARGRWRPCGGMTVRRWEDFAGKRRRLEATEEAPPRR